MSARSIPITSEGDAHYTADRLPLAIVIGPTGCSLARVGGVPSFMAIGGTVN